MVVDGFKLGVVLEACGAGIGYSIEGIATTTQPPGLVQQCGHIFKERIQVLRQKQASNHHVSMLIHLCS